MVFSSSFALAVSLVEAVITYWSVWPGLNWYLSGVWAWAAVCTERAVNRARKRFRGIMGKNTPKGMLRLPRARLPRAGLEPARLAAQDPKSCVAASYTTSALFLL